MREGPKGNPFPRSLPVLLSEHYTIALQTPGTGNGTRSQCLPSCFDHHTFQVRREVCGRIWQGLFCCSSYSEVHICSRTNLFVFLFVCFGTQHKTSIFKIPMRKLLWKGLLFIWAALHNFQVTLKHVYCKINCVCSPVTCKAPEVLAACKFWTLIPLINWHCWLSGWMVGTNGIWRFFLNAFNLWLLNSQLSAQKQVTGVSSLRPWM